MDASDVIKEAIKPVRRPGAGADVRAIVAGAVGRRGETLLNTVLSVGRYTEVTALVDENIALGIKQLSTATLDALPECQDLFLLISDASNPETRSFHGRDAAFVLTDETNSKAIVDKAIERGVQRVALINPAPIWLQFGEMSRATGDALERHLQELALQRLVIMRPMKQVTASGGGITQRIINFYLSIQLMAMPRSMPVMTSDQIARLAIHLLNNGQGADIYNAQQLGEHHKKMRDLIASG